MANFGERAANSVNRILSGFVLCLFVILAVSHFGFEDQTSVLIAPVSGHFLSFYFEYFLCLHEL